LRLEDLKNQLDQHIGRQFSAQQIELANYQTATPFPHTVIEDFFPADVIEQVLAEFPEAGSSAWPSRYDNVNENKRASSDFFTWGPVTQGVFIYLNSAPFLKRLEVLTGIEKRIPDPYFLGGGLHCLPTGGKLNVHVDFNEHPAMNLDRRINLLVYLNKDWDAQYGGNLVLKGESDEKLVVPQCNRTVVFSTTSSSFHGNPEPVCAPQDRERISLALYYYTSSRPADEQVSHTTIFKLQEDQMVATAAQARQFEDGLRMIHQIVHGGMNSNQKVKKIKAIFS
jgi:hypothetical protein